MKGFFTTLLLLGAFQLILAGSVISGTDIRYAGQELIVLKKADPFTGKEYELGSGIVDSSGNFSIDIVLDQIREVYIYSGNKRLRLFVEPEKNYQVILPEFVALTQANRLNPYFSHIDIHLATKVSTEDDLNVQIRMFMDAYQPYMNKHIDKVFTDLDFEQLDKDIKNMEKPFAKSQNGFFNEYRIYKFGMLRFLAYQQKSKSISDQYFKGKPVLYNNPAYIELFNKVYEKYFMHFSRADKDKTLINALSKEKTFNALRTSLQSDEVLQPDEMLNLVALKCLHDEFYDDNYPRSSMLEVLETFIAGEEPEIQKVIANNIIEKVTRLLVGFEPPAFELYDTDSNLVSLDQFKGKFVYLNFCSCFSYSCLNEFAQLQRLYEKHNKYLEIVSIVIDDDVQVVKDFVVRSGYSWKFLHFGNHPEVLQEYDIRTFPTYYLIDHEGKLSMSPAATPNEAFEGRLFKELRAKGIL